MIRVRLASIDDVELLTGVYAAAWRRGLADLFPTWVFAGDHFDTDRHAEVRALVLDDSVTTSVAEIDGRVLGFAGIADDGCLDDLWVHPDGWGSGVAPTLVAQLVDGQRSLGVRRLTTWAPENSPRARGFLAKTGWRPTGEAQPMVVYPEHPNLLFEFDRVLV